MKILRAFVLVLPLATVAAPAFASDHPSHVAILDAQQREIVPGGYVTITEDAKGAIHYAPEDYRRMARMGASFQVIRTTLGKLGGWPGKQADPAYLAQLDDMVRMGRDVGLKSIFKLVIYDIRPFGAEQWDALYDNANGAQDALLAAWEKVWTRYKDEPSVFGYDLLNEPQRGRNTDYERCCRERLLPTLRRLADAMHAISPDKWALYQPLFLNAEDRLKGVNPFVPMKEPFGRKRVIYCPHLYQMDPVLLNKTLDDYLRQAELSHAPLLIGEWGPATPLAVDTNLARQAAYTKAYQANANAFDQHGAGAIKAWFCGSRAPLRSKSQRAPFTWAIFSDTDPVGRVERKYITDVLARPRPLVVAGHLEHYGYDFASRVLEVNLRPDSGLRDTLLFVPAERFYSSGFRLKVGSGLELVLNPGDAQFRIVKAADETNRNQASLVHWDAELEHIVIEKWVVNTPTLILTIAPMQETAAPPASATPK